jgi:hypothetical protein
MSGHPPTDRELADLAALADGSLAPERRGDVEALVAASPRLQELLAEQLAAVEVLRARAERAPPGLRAWVNARRREGGARARFPRLGLAAGLAAAAATAALALVVVLSGGGASGPSVAQAANLASKSPTAPAPRPYTQQPVLLRLEVGHVPYPNWDRDFGWKAVGRRTDRLKGRRMTTVFYERRGRRLAYTIVAGSALSKPDGERSVRRGVELRSLTAGGRTVVTWRRKGHTCVLSGADRSEMLALASWKAGGSVPY